MVRQAVPPKFWLLHAIVFSLPSRQSKRKVPLPFSVVITCCAGCSVYLAAARPTMLGGREYANAVWTATEVL